MSTPKPTPTPARPLRSHAGRYVAMVGVAWTLAVGIFTAYMIVNALGETEQVAKVNAQAANDKDILYRRWVAVQGGVYIPISDSTPPNPYLNVPERDITTPAGKRLTLVNSAYMVRQVYELGAKEGKVFGHITSLKPLRPENAPDAWEAEALEALARGDPEYGAMAAIQGQPHFRYMKPLRVEASCLKCHGNEGYKVGDIRGGISSSVPLEPLVAARNQQILAGSVGCGVLWLAGLGGLILGTRQRRRADAANAAAQEARRQENAKLTAMIGVMDDGVLFGNALGVIVEVNDSFCRLVGLPRKRIIGHSIQEFHPADVAGRIQAYIGKFRTEPDSRTITLERSIHGAEVIMRLQPIYQDGRYQGVMLDVANVTELVRARREAEDASRQSIQRAEELDAARLASLNIADDLDRREKALRETQAQLHEANERLEQLATTDVLTGVWNRRWFTETLDREIERSRRNGSNLALVMFDLDHFKAVNDTHGHAVGDVVLTRAAQALKAEARAADVVVRYGGEEFLVLMPDTSQADAVAAAERLRLKIAEQTIAAGEHTVRITASAGVAVADSPATRVPDVLLRMVDEALYDAKHAGRNRTCVYGAACPLPAEVSPR